LRRPADKRIASRGISGTSSGFALGASTASASERVIEDSIMPFGAEPTWSETQLKFA
jgi:hypothetical protein